MRAWPTIAVTVLASILVVQGAAASFSLFPKASELMSPDRRFVVRNGDGESTQEFAGIFHSLWLTEVETGRSRRLCDYPGVAAVAWADHDFVIVTQYLNRKTSRALAFSAMSAEDSVLIDVPTLTHLVPPDLRESLRDNDHVFVEASGLEGGTLFLTVWGYGHHDADGFRWRCEYTLTEGSISCRTGRS